jgi:hypothetical protein
VSEDDLTNVVQLSPLGKQDPLQGSFIQGCGFESALFLQAGSGSGSTLKSKFTIFRGSKQSRAGPWALTPEARGLKMEPRRFYRPVVAGSHHFEKEQDSDLHKSEKLDPDLDPF